MSFQALLAKLLVAPLLALLTLLSMLSACWFCAATAWRSQAMFWWQWLLARSRRLAALVSTHY